MSRPISRTSTLLARSRNELATRGRSVGAVYKSGRVNPLAAVVLASGVPAETVKTEPVVPFSPLAKSAVKLLDKEAAKATDRSVDGILTLSDTNPGAKGTKLVLGVFDAAIVTATKLEAEAYRKTAAAKAA